MFLILCVSFLVPVFMFYLKEQVKFSQNLFLEDLSQILGKSRPYMIYKLFLYKLTVADWLRIYHRPWWTEGGPNGCGLRNEGVVKDKCRCDSQIS